MYSGTAHPTCSSTPVGFNHITCSSDLGWLTNTFQRERLWMVSGLLLDSRPLDSLEGLLQLKCKTKQNTTLEISTVSSG